MFCPKCGAQQPDGSHFCRLCGTNLSIVSDAMSNAPAGQQAPAISFGGTTLALFHHQSITNENQSLDGHGAAAIFGGVMLDLTARPLPDGETRVSVYSIFGGVDVLVSEDIGVRVTGVSVFSGINVRGHQLGNGVLSVNEYLSPGYASTVRRIHIDATAIFGGIKIR
jgi:predicted membrane protein